MSERGRSKDKSCLSICTCLRDLASRLRCQKLTQDCDVRIEHLPIEIHHLGEIDTAKIQPPGIALSGNKYVVPGGRFNEMYGMG